MDTLVEKVIKLDLEQIPFANFPKNERFGLIVNCHDGIKYEMLLNIKNSNKLLVLCPSVRPENQSIEDKKRPFFNRWSWNFNESTICLNDPTTYINYNLDGGWGVGTSDNHYLINIKKIIEKIAENCVIKNENIIFYGSSQGGFLSLYLAILIKDAIAISEIPQFDVSIYIKEHWDNIKKFCFNNLDEDYIREKYGDRFDIIELIKKTKYIPKAYILLDCSVDYDFKNIYIPFFKRLNELPFNQMNNKLIIDVYGNNIGHSPITYSELIKIIENVKKINFNEENNQNKVTNNNPYFTARIDIKNVGNNDNKIKILEISDEDSFVNFPYWFQDETGKGIVIESCDGELDLKIKCINDGELNIYLRGVDFIYDNKRYPIFIKYQTFQINNKHILQDKIISHDDFYHITQKVENNQILELNLTWTPI